MWAVATSRTMLSLSPKSLSTRLLRNATPIFSCLHANRCLHLCPVRTCVEQRRSMSLEPLLARWALRVPPKETTTATLSASSVALSKLFQQNDKKSKSSQPNYIGLFIFAHVFFLRRLASSHFAYAHCYLIAIGLVLTYPVFRSTISRSSRFHADVHLPSAALIMLPDVLRLKMCP